MFLEELKNWELLCIRQPLRRNSERVVHRERGQVGDAQVCGETGRLDTRESHKVLPQGFLVLREAGVLVSV